MGRIARTRAVSFAKTSSESLRSIRDPLIRRQVQAPSLVGGREAELDL